MVSEDFFLMSALAFLYSEPQEKSESEEAFVFA